MTGRPAIPARGGTRTRIAADVSRRFDVLKILLVFGVVLIHAERVIHAYLPEPSLGLRVMAAFLVPNLLQSCVPLFFAMSGYLFHFSFTPTPAGYGRMLVKKTRGIAVPYLFLNLVAVGLILTFNKIPYVGDFHTVAERGVLSLVTGIGGMPILSPLWFLRDLMFIFLLSPILCFLARRMPLAGVVGVYVLWNALPGGYVGFFSLLGVFFFHLGLVLAGTRPGLDMGEGLSRAVLTFYPLVLGIGTAAVLVEAPSRLFWYLHNAGLVLGVLFFWRLSALPALRDNRFLLSLAPYSFFLYLLHEPTLSYLIYVVRFVSAPTGFFSGMLWYLTLAAATSALVLGAGMVLARRAPGVYGFLTGFRASPTAAPGPGRGG